MSFSKTVILNKMKQLIDLNGDKTNFNLKFNVKSKNNDPFDVIVVSQSILDSGDELEYKHITNGSINGEIISDKGVYQNYFLLLKSDNPTECEVVTEIQDAPLNVEIQKQQELYNRQQVEQQQLEKQKQEQLYNRDTKPEVKSSEFNFKKILIIIGIIVGGILLYFYLKPSNKKSTLNSVIPKDGGFIDSSSIDNSFNTLDNSHLLQDYELNNSVLNSTIDTSALNSVIDTSKSLNVVDNSVLNSAMDNSLINKLVNNNVNNLASKLNNLDLY